ncbi:MAG TPA: hypothetical protein VFI06_04640 [Chitinophagaceae bacterium]|nr:hypothetical protein [Chitinophagaceae bacterium]
MPSHTTKLPVFPILFILIILTSCQKELSFSNDTSRVDSVGSVDSTQLIRSLVSFDQISGDSAVESYSYDTVNRKITISWTGLISPFTPDPVKAELSYNDDSMLTHMDYTYPAGYIPQAFDVISAAITYDADKILHEITEIYGDGHSETKLYTKTMLSSGSYQLGWDMPDPSMPTSKYKRRAVFNSAGRNIVSVSDDSFIAEYSPAGDPVFTNLIVSDSLFYNASGSIIKVVRNTVDTLRHTNQSYTFFNFSKLTKGDQLYNHRQRLLHGIAEMPFGDGDPSYVLGFSANSLEHENWQYSKYPLLSADIRWLGTDYHFNGTAQFDSLGRLVKLNIFWLDLTLTQQELRIRYYK